MRIEYNVSVAASEEECHTFGAVVSAVAKSMGVPIEAIEEVIVATEDRFEEVVGRFDSTKRYTNSRGLIAAGKLFTHRHPTKSPTFSILFQHSVARGIVTTLETVPEHIDQWTGERQRELYVVYHELGHCKDNLARAEDLDDGTFRNALGQRAVDNYYPNICKYHHSMLLDELAACVHSGPGFTEKTRDLDCTMNNQFVLRQIDHISKMVFSDENDLETIRIEAISVFWFILMQQAKHTGSWLGNSKLPDAAPRDLWNIARVNENISKIFIQADMAMQTAWKTYPSFSPEFRNEITNCVNDLAAECGFRFMQNGRDGVWWNSLRLLEVQRTLKQADT